MLDDAIRCPPEHADIASLPSLRGLPERVAQRRYDLVRRGVVLKEELELFPPRRVHRDALGTVAFFGSFLLFVGLGAYLSKPNADPADTLLAASFPEWLRPKVGDSVLGRRLANTKTAEDNVSWNIFLSVVTFSSVGGFLCAMVVLQLLRSGGEQVLFHCTVLLPALRLITGLLCMIYPWNSFTPNKYYRESINDGILRDCCRALYFLFGAVLTICSLCNICISLHVRHLARPWLALQASLMNTVSRVVLAHPGMLLVPLSCAALLYLWTIACISAFTAILNVDETDESLWPESAIFPTFGLICWGGGVASYVTILAFCGVYSRWYFSRSEPPVLVSFRSSMAFALGTACIASFWRLSVRTIEILSRLIQPAGPDCKANPVRACLTCIFGCVLECVFHLVGDVSQFCNTWAFTQCAIRNASFMQSTCLTVAVCTCANVTLLANNLVLDYVTGSGTQVGGLLGFLVGAVAHYLGEWAWLHCAPAVGFVCGAIMTSIVLSVAKTGFKSILVLWAESCEPLQQLEPQTHDAIVSCIKKRLEENRQRTVSEMSQLSR
ncbi:ACSBG2 [Symbiodinium natans]|uniref:Choline transporter-like protein n=1 Tax=Symbiodinium natans TaxID=878477 RepID=A0A812QZN7_9DINO|nr:ACSBG2 [Symbiodinium natans]